MLLTSHDRTIVAAKGSRLVNEVNLLCDYEHNTPLVFGIFGKNDADFSVDIHSSGGKMDTYHVELKKADGRFVIPQALDVKSYNFPLRMFDAALPVKAKFNN